MTKRSRILIVDDEPFNVDYLEQELEHLGYETESAASGQEALEKVTAEAPDLILLDIMMPGIDGLTVCRLLKDDRKTRRIPIVIMTALNAFADRIKGIEAGADDFLTKPANERELVARIKTALRLKHSVDDEIGELRKIGDHLAKFVPDSVKRLIAANPEDPGLAKREQDVSVLFLDITGYTRLSELMPAEVLNRIVERYFSSFLDRIHQVEGEISETSGDGLMAIFSDPDPDRHAEKSADTALALLAANEALNEENTVQPLSVHIGLNSGPALVGSTRFEGRRGARWVFTADGAVTNLAARLAGIAKAGEIVAGIETVRRLKDRYPVEEMGPQSLRNIAEPVAVYRLLAPPSAKPRTRRIEVEPGTSPAEAAGQRRLGVILAVDALGPEVQTVAGLKWARDLLEPLLGGYRGRLLAEDGGGSLIEFGSPADALSFAIALQRRVDGCVEGEDPNGMMRPRIGLHLGHIVAQDGAPRGDGVEGAVQLKALAEPGGICVSERIRHNVPAQPDVDFDELGLHGIAGSAENLRAFHVQFAAAAPPGPDPAPET